MKPLFYFKNPEFKFIGYRFFFLGTFLLLFYNETYGHDRDEILLPSSGEDNVKTNLKTGHDKYRVVNVLNAGEKAEVYSRDFMAVSTAYGFISSGPGT